MKKGKISEFVYILTLSVWFSKFTQWYCILSLWGVYTFGYYMIFEISKLKKELRMDFLQKGQIQYNLNIPKLQATTININQYNIT